MKGAVVSSKLTWHGADNGREGFLKADKWFKTLKILAQHEGESTNDPGSPLFEALEKEMPEDSWIGKSKGRTAFRGYQAAWTGLGAIKPTQETGQIVELTDKGREVVANGDVTQFFRLYIDECLEEWEIDGRSALVSPYEFIAHAIILRPNDDDEILISELEHDAEQLASISVSTSYPLLEFDNSTSINMRRFKTYLIVLENADAIERMQGKVKITDWEYLNSIVRKGTLAILPDAVVMSIEFDWNSPIDLPDNITEDLRRRKQAYRVVRDERKNFRSRILRAYDNTCCITGSTERSVLQAAHIMSYMGRQTDFTGNGLLMAVDVHTLFDCGKLLINPETLAVELANDITDSRYLQYQGQVIRTPTADDSQPNRNALRRKYQLSRSA